MEKIKQLLDRVDIRVLIEKDFELRDYGTYSKAVAHDSLVIDHSKNYFYWNSLEIRGNGLDWLTTIKGLPIIDAVKQLKEIAGDIPKQRVFEYPTEINIYPKLLDLFYELGKDHRDYWYNKKYSDNTIDRFKLGFTGKCYTIPVTFNEILLNFQCKVPKIGDKPKKIWAWASGIGVLPFNFDALKDVKSVFITESPGSAISLSQHGFTAVSQTGGATNWNKLWNQYFISATEIIFLYDADKAGFLGANRVARQFEDRARVLVWPEGFKLKYGIDDYINDNGPQEFLRLVLNNSFSLREIEPYKNTIIKYYDNLELKSENN